MTDAQRKAMMEKRAGLIEEMEALNNKMATENRGFTEEEKDNFESKAKEVRGIDAAIKADEETRALYTAPKVAAKEETEEDREVRAFASTIRQRAVDQNITKSDNEAVIPTTIARKIVDHVYDISPVFGQAEKFNVKGNVAVPYVDKANDNIVAGYATEFEDLVAKSTKLATIQLSGHLVGALAKISRSLINSTDIELVNFVVRKIAQAEARFIDQEVLKGTSQKIEGCLGITQEFDAAAATAITMDEIISVKDMIKTPFQKSAIWVMHPETLDMIRHLKDGINRYYVLDDPTNDFGVSLLGKPVYTSDQMAKATANASSIYYGDFGQGLAGKVVEDSVQILNEKYAIQHAIGVVAWMELDCKVQNAQALAALVQGSGVSA